MIDFENIVRLCSVSPVGKLLPSALYVHIKCLKALDPTLQEYERSARVSAELEGATIVKFNTDKPIVSYLFYPDFDSHPHPALRKSIVVDTRTLTANTWNYRDSDNPPVLHRKETFITPDYPGYGEFKNLTEAEIALGLLAKSRSIGTSNEWRKLLQTHRVSFNGHYLVCPLDNRTVPTTFIDRHKAAIQRKSLSRPVRLALDTGILKENSTFFDYGCGYGGDVARLVDRGYDSAGWDPYYCADNPIVPADIVNLGYVINVIEDRDERQRTLLKAWELTRKVLIVSAQILVDDSERGLVAYEDGVITRRNTFQKYYRMEELKQYIDSNLGVDSIPLSLGIYAVFRSETEAGNFRLSRFRSRTPTPKISRGQKNFEDYRELLTPLMDFYTERGRLPVSGEIEAEEAIKAELGSFKRAFQIILQVSEVGEWDRIADNCREEILIGLALSLFDRPERRRELSPTTRADIKAFFGSYRGALTLAEGILRSAGDMLTIKQICDSSPVGKRLPGSLGVHVRYLDRLPLLLRLYEGCAATAIGRLEEANVIRLSSRYPRISYLYYPDFDTLPHPLLKTRMDVYLGSANVAYRDYTDHPDPPILHEKELLLLPDYPGYDKFARLTRREREWGLLTDFKAIKHRQGWEKCLAEHRAILNGYRLTRHKSVDSQKMRMLNALTKIGKRDG